MPSFCNNKGLFLSFLTYLRSFFPYFIISDKKVYSILRGFQTGHYGYWKKDSLTGLGGVPGEGGPLPGFSLNHRIASSSAVWRCHLSIASSSSAGVKIGYPIPGREGTGGGYNQVRKVVTRKDGSGTHQDLNRDDVLQRSVGDSIRRHR